MDLSYYVNNHIYHTFKTIAKGMLLLSVLLLQGCFNAAVSSAQAVYNHQSIQKNINDQFITLQAYKQVNKHRDYFANSNITIATFNNEILLTGQTLDLEQKNSLESYIKTIPNIDRVYNLVSIQPPTSHITRLSDAWITAKIKSKLIASEDVDATQVKVVTENSTVYLMGILQPDEAEAAVNVARDTAGVERVVKMFSYIRITRS